MADEYKTSAANFYAQAYGQGGSGRPAFTPTPIMNSTGASSSTPVPARALRQSTRKKVAATPRDSPGLVSQQQPPQQQQPTPQQQQQQAQQAHIAAITAAFPPVGQSMYAHYYPPGMTPATFAQNQANPYSTATLPGAALPTQAPGVASNVPPLPVTPQAIQSTYASRLRTGVSLLMQPIMAPSSSATAGMAVGGRKPRVNYADGMSADEFEDDSDDSEAVAARAKRAAASKAAAQALLNKPQPNEPEHSYLGKVPPSRMITTKTAIKTKHVYCTEDDMTRYVALAPEVLIPIRVEVDTDTHRIRDCFLWNMNERIISPDHFAQTFCQDLDLPLSHVETIVSMMRAQIEEHSAIARLPLMTGYDDEEPDCRVILRLDVQIDNHHLVDHIEWDLCSPTPPEVFARELCKDLGLGGEAAPLVAHAITEEILLHKKDAVEWGVVGGGPLEYSFGRGSQRGPRKLKSIWRDWMEVKDYGPRIDELTAEDLEKREMERERASRRMRRETNKFQRGTVSSYYRDRNRSSRNR